MHVQPRFGQVTLSVGPRGQDSTAPLAEAVTADNLDVVLGIDKRNPGGFLINGSPVQTDDKAARLVGALEAVANEYVTQYEATGQQQDKLSEQIRQRIQTIQTELLDEEEKLLDQGQPLPWDYDEEEMRRMTTDPQLKELHTALEKEQEYKREVRYATGKVISRMLPQFFSHMLAGMPGADNHALQSGLQRLADQANRGRLPFITTEEGKIGVNIRLRG